MSLSWPASLDFDARVTLEPVSRNVWDRFIADSPGALLFHTSDWLELLARVYGVAWHRLGVWSGDRLVGLFPLLTRRPGPFRLAGSPLMLAVASTPFMGPLVAPGQVSLTLSALDKWLCLWKAHHIEIAFPMRLEDVAAAMQLG